MAHTPNKPLRTQFVYRRCHPGDYQALRFLVRESWPVDMRDQVDDILKDALTHPDSTAIFACFANDDAVAYAQVSVRQEYTEGASTYPIAYLDALYIRQNLRPLGVGQRLVDLVTTYVNSLGIEELAADCLSSDLQQFELYLQSGFEEVSQMTHFVKSIPLKMRRS